MLSTTSASLPSVLNISNDRMLLKTRHLVLESFGFDVQSRDSFTARHLPIHDYRLIVVCYTVPDLEAELIEYLLGAPSGTPLVLRLHKTLCQEIHHLNGDTRGIPGWARAAQFLMRPMDARSRKYHCPSLVLFLLGKQSGSSCAVATA